MRPFHSISFFLFIFAVLAVTDDTSNGGYWESPDFSGAFWVERPGSFNRVTGTFTVPNVSGGSDTGVYLWVGIDGITCTSAYLSTGITVVVSGDENTYSVWSKWSPDGVYDLNLTISAGDVLKATVIAINTTSGVAGIENLTTGQSKYQHLASASLLCQQNAEWAVQVHQPNATVPPIGNFSTVTFWNAVAQGTNGSYGPKGANKVVLHDQNNQTVTSVALNDSFVSVTYL